MNNLAYTSQDPIYVGQKIEEKIREEIGSSTPLPYTVEQGDAASVSAGSFLKDIGKGLIGGSADVLFYLNFEFPGQRPATLQVAVNRQGVGSHAGLCMYNAKIAKPVPGETSLDDPKFFGKSKFSGDGATAEKLNSNGDLIKIANGLARLEGESGGMGLKIKRCCRVVPDGEGGNLIVATLPRPTKMGMSAAVDVQDFFHLAQLVESCL
ncbi:MAG: hypothetical protein JO314_03440 [Acidobacteria bacterium]|nr:hypothetical protein [Acidobacteriota bacterium]